MEIGLQNSTGEQKSMGSGQTSKFNRGLQTNKKVLCLTFYQDPQKLDYPQIQYSLDIYMTVLHQ